MRKQVLALVVGIVLGVACVWLVLRDRSTAPGKAIPDLSRTSPLNQPGGGDIPAEDYEPYSALYQQQPSDDPLAFAADSYADIPQLNGSCLEPASGEEREMADAFAAANQKSHRWQRRFAIPQGYQLLSTPEVQQAEYCLDPHSQGAARCASYTNLRHVRLLGIPGFDRNHTHALVSIAREFGTHRGTGGIFEVERTSSGWRRAASSDLTRNCSWMY